MCARASTCRPVWPALSPPAQRFRRDPCLAKLFLRNDWPLPRGDRFRNPDLANLLEKLAGRGSVESFYRGDVARQIAEAFARNKGLVTVKDMAAYRAREVKPLTLDWQGWTIHTAPLTAGGLTILQTIATLKALGWSKWEQKDFRRAYARIETLRIAWHDRLRWLGDPDHAAVPVERLLSERYARLSAARVLQALKSNKPLEGDSDGRSAGGTIHLTAVDAQGMMAAVTLAHGESFGANVGVDGLGLILGHGMSRFDPRPGRNNSPGPNKRPLHNMCPTIACRDGKPVLALGAVGGRRIPNTIFDVLTRRIGEGRTLADAVAAPRLHSEGERALTVEGKWPAAEVKRLKEIGYQVRIGYGARLNAIERDPRTGTLTAPPAEERAPAVIEPGGKRPCRSGGRPASPKGERVMNSILDALQNEIRLFPDDDAPRLVLADWLEETGDEADRARGEFIRIQCQLARPKVAGRADLEWRERSLWWQHVEAWLGPVYDASSSFRFHRGLAAIDLDGDRLPNEDWQALFASPSWAWVERLNLSNARPGMLKQFLHSPAASRLRCLDMEGGEELWRNDLGLAECGQLELLNELRIRHTGLDEAGVGMLAGCPSLTGLTVLDLGHNLLHGPGLEALAHAPGLAGLHSLELIHNPLGYDQREVALRALRGFLNSPLAGRLSRLGLAQTALGPRGVEMLAASQALSRLTELDLSANSIHDAEVETLAGSPVLEKMKRLTLSHNEIDARGVAALARSPYLEDLEWLDLSGNALNTMALRGLAQAPRWWKLRRLRLGPQRVDAPRLLGELRARFGHAIEFY